MKKDPRTYVEHIKESISWIEKYLEGVSKEELFGSMEKQDALVRRLEIIGEATKALPEAFKQEHPEIPWRDIAGMRDNLVHEYFDVDLEEVWKTATADIPDLKKKLSDL